MGGNSLNLTRIDYDQGLQWSKDYTFGDGISSPKVIEWPQENAFLITGFALTNAQNRILIKVDNSGNLLWSRRYGGNGDVYVANRGISDAVVLPSGNVIMAGGANQISNGTGANDLFVGKID